MSLKAGTGQVGLTQPLSTMQIRGSHQLGIWDVFPTGTGYHPIGNCYPTSKDDFKDDAGATFYYKAGQASTLSLVELRRSPLACYALRYFYFDAPP